MMFATLTRHLAGFLAMSLGGLGTVLLVLAMNGAGPEPPKEKAQTATKMAVAPKKEPPKKKKRQRKKKRTPKKVTRAKAPPPPAISTALSGIDLGIPSAGTAHLGMDGKSLVDAGDAARSQPMTTDSVDVPPKANRRISPQYPARARAADQEGKVTLRILIGTAGEVLKVRLVDSSPPGIFEQAAIDAIRQWQFSPAMYQGSPVKVWARQVIDFDLG